MVIIYVVFFQRPILNIFVLDIEKYWFQLVSSQIFFFCMLFSFLFWFCFWYCFKHSYHRWCGHDWHLFKPCLLAHDFLQKGQIHVVSIEYAKLSVFQTWIESFYCNWFLIQIFYFIHVFSFIFWYCFEYFLSSLVWTWLKKFANPFKPRLLTHDFLQKRQIRDVSVEYAKLSVFETWIENFNYNWFSIQNFYFIYSFLDSLEKKYRPWSVQAKRKIALELCNGLGNYY